MLLIWDIHITWTYLNKTINSIKSFIDNNPTEDNIVFLGDYVYHFSYDRKSLLALFELFVELFESWKNVYVLAGNHDWISDKFVFLEWQKSFDIINGKFKNKLNFITKPELVNVEWRDVLFFPYTYESSQNIQKYQNPKWKIELTINSLLDSENKYEKVSARINNDLYEYLSENPELLVIHHYYIADTVFTWQKSRFSYKDIAIIPDFLSEFPKSHYISWHLHQWFVYKNYFCTWSIWNTSFLEQNQFKFLYKYDPKENIINSYNININPYLFWDSNDFINEDSIRDFITQVYNNNLDNFKSWDFKFEDNWLQELIFKDIVLTIFSDNIEYDNIYDIIDESLYNKLKELKIKKQKLNINSVVNMAEELQKDLETSVSWWRDLLKSYIEQKYKSDSGRYEQKLKDLKIL